MLFAINLTFFRQIPYDKQCQQCQLLQRKTKQRKLMTVGIVLGNPVMISKLELEIVFVDVGDFITNHLQLLN